MELSKGNIGVISESGGFAGHILQCGSEMGVGFSKFVSTGNEADLHFEDFFEYYARDEDTKVITAYIEGLREGPRFFRIAREITKTKPVVVVKVGRTNAGKRAAKSHTSAIAGSDDIYDAMFMPGSKGLPYTEVGFDLRDPHLYPMDVLDAENRLFGEEDSRLSWYSCKYPESKLFS